MMIIGVPHAFRDSYIMLESIKTLTPIVVFYCIMTSSHCENCENGRLFAPFAVFLILALPRAIRVQFCTEMDREDLDLLEASIGRSDPAGSAQVRSGSRVPTSSPSSPGRSGWANGSPPRSDRPLRRRSRLSVSDDELDFQPPGSAVVRPDCKVDDDSASNMGNASLADFK